MTDSKPAFVIEGPSTKSFPFSGTWSDHMLLRIEKYRKVTLTNTSPNDATIRRNGEPRRLPARSLEVVGVQPGDEIRVEVSPGERADGYWVLHDTRSDWQITDPSKRFEAAHSGPLDLAVVSHPQSDFVVQWVTSEDLLARLGPGEAASRGLTQEQARTMALQAQPGSPAPTGQARGVICGVD